MDDLLHLATVTAALALGALAARRDLGFGLAWAASALIACATSIALLVHLAGGTWPAAFVLGALVPIAALIAEIDRRIKLIPNELVAAVIALAITAPFGDGVIMQGFGAILVGGLFLGVRNAFAQRGQTEALGLGDVKLATALGAFLGPYHGLVAVALAGASTLAVTFATSRTETLKVAGAPFGIGLAAALAAVAATRFWNLA